MYFHYRHSSVRLLPSGILQEIRRGYGSPSTLQNPMNWTTMNEWMQFAQSLVIKYPFDENWTPDQIWTAQWFRHETLHRISGKDYVTPTMNRILELRDAFLREPTNDILHELLHYENVYKYIYTNMHKTKYRIVSNRSPKMLLQDQYGYLHNVYMCLTTGAIAIDSAKCVGTSFAELGIQPSAIFNREFGVYYRVL